MSRARHDLLGDSVGARPSQSEKSAKGSAAEKSQKPKLIIAVAVLLVAGALILYQILPTLSAGQPAPLTEDQINQPPDMTGTIPTAPVPVDPPRGQGAGKRPVAN